VRRWVNRRTGATEFTATICSNDLAYLNWRPAPRVESSHVTIAELHARLNHLPHSAVRLLVREKAITGLPDHVTGPTGDVFCEDCVNGKLTRAPHTTLAARAERPLLRVFSYVHGPLPVHSRVATFIGSRSSTITHVSLLCTSSRGSPMFSTLFASIRLGQRI